MNSKWTSVLTGAVVAALLIGAAALGAVMARPAAIQAAQANPVPIRQMMVVGSGEAKAAPNQATVQLGVQSEAQSAREAMTQNAAKMQALLDQLKQLGIADKDLQTSNFSISPTYEQDGRSITGYQVNNTVSVVIRDISRSSELLDKVVSAGANNVFGLSFSIDDPKALQAQARNAAIADAQARAAEMAKTAGGTVGQIIAISETIGQVQPVMAFARGEAADSAAGAPPIATGEQTINAQVQVTFELR